MTPATAGGSPKAGDDVLRPEAQPLKYAELDRQQQTALERVIGLLAAAATTAEDAAKSSVREGTSSGLPTPTSVAGPYLESNRASRNILVSGQRGTGKTTLMLSIAKLLAPNPRGGPGSADDSLPAGIDDKINWLRPRLVWLETLDMEPLSSEVNLLGAVLARVEDAVGKYFPGLDRAPETTSLLHPGAGFHDVSRDLALLQTSVALTLSGNLEERAGSLDPDTFAIESRRAERERLGIDRRFAAVLAGLSSAMSSTVALTAPVFVLPVDDADLNVNDCAPLLRLLRATSSPHLVVLLAADVTLLATILRLRYLGELARISAPVQLSDNDQRVASDLAVNALRKHLPPAQRVVLGLIKPERALALTPLGRNSPALHQVLGTVVLREDEGILQCADHFGLPTTDLEVVARTRGPQWPAAPRETDADRSEPTNVTTAAAAAADIGAQLARFSWSQVLHLPMRQVVDLYLECAMYAESNEADGQHAGEDSPLLQLAIARSTPIRNQDPTYEVGARTTEPRPVNTGTVAIQHRMWHGWTASAYSVPLDTDDAALLAGSIDLLGDRWGQGITGLPAPYLQPLRASRWPGPKRDEVVVDWPWVTHTSFWAYERAVAWLTEADALWANQEQPDAAFGSWVAVMTAQLFHAPDGAQPFDRPTTPLAPDWTALATQLLALQSKESPEAARWLDAAGLLCTPEMGMTSPGQLSMLLPAAVNGRIQALREQRASTLPHSLRAMATAPLPKRAAPRKAARPSTSP